ncbi:acyl-CoA thioesterase [Sphingomonas sanguinis]|jgi:acyl-CoA thioesterase-2|uniref:Acyl-CoA thioesterase 2 n=1 Tax=Sphingomonas sanguinis TaxID=33051 RepID=A0A7Y7UPV8_9SPHN|nr:acyl-CoA thioesterase II [Sphingomonas sanguinis]MBZ6380262.1 acyl-CoA thioesterase II [Sphingomonas sanguinis]NNG48892.1 acyl-CoA thioesterase II [Sphingomonas sanguinis]NNG52141.1 acyl-CoA thioesterase II [Sphingomonas sanguinis]NVP29565.1 acyl-CoA thioesterase II [Sphingomonas sanguinis]
MTDRTLPSPEALAQGLVALLDVEEIDTDLYRGARQPGGEGRVFGGQVIAQALQAAQRSTEAPRTAHSLHAYFMRPGDERYPILYRVERDFEGRSFATRRVIAMQKGKPILNLACSFQTPEEGLHHQDAMPNVPAPDTLTPERELLARLGDQVPAPLRAFLQRPRPIELRPVDPRQMLAPEPRDPTQAIWFRLVAPIGDDPALHRAVLAYASDFALLGTSTLPHGVNWLIDDMQTASLDHALWLHEPFRADEWLLYTTDSPWAGRARGFNRGRIFSADGRLVASVAQEGLIRLRSSPSA